MCTLRSLRLLLYAYQKKKKNPRHRAGTKLNLKNLNLPQLTRIACLPTALGF